MIIMNQHIPCNEQKSDKLLNEKQQLESHFKSIFNHCHCPAHPSPHTFIIRYHIKSSAKKYYKSFVGKVKTAATRCQQFMYLLDFTHAADANKQQQQQQHWQQQQQRGSSCNLFLGWFAQCALRFGNRIHLLIRLSNCSSSSRHATTTRTTPTTTTLFANVQHDNRKT